MLLTEFLFSIYSESERYTKIPWKDVRVGDLVHLSNNENVPADILLLRSSNADGVCYIDTCDLDGESNLKSREVRVARQSEPSFNKTHLFVHAGGSWFWW